MRRRFDPRAGRLHVDTSPGWEHEGKNGGHSVRTKPGILLSVAALAWACSPAANADTFKVVTAPIPGQPLPESSIKVVTAPIPGQQLPASSIQVVHPPSSDQTTAQVVEDRPLNCPSSDEPPPGQEFNPNPVAPELTPIHPTPNLAVTERQGCADNLAKLPCSVIQRVVIPSGTGRQIDFGAPFASVYASDSDIIDVSPINDHAMFIKPKRQEQTVTQNSGNTTSTIMSNDVLSKGNSDIFVYDKDSNRIGIIEVTIDDFAFRKNNPIRQDTLAKQAGWVTIYHGTGLRHPFPYRCAGEIGGCYFVGTDTSTGPQTK